MSLDLIEKTGIKNPGEFMYVKGAKASVAGERRVIVYLICQNGCPNAIAVGDDQWDGLASVQCNTCKQTFYVDEHARLIPVKR